MRKHYSIWAVKVSGTFMEQYVCCETFEQACEWAEERRKDDARYNDTLDFKDPEPVITSVSRVHANCERWPDA